MAVAKEYGERIEVESEPLSSKSLGSFDSSDSEGNLEIVTVEEQVFRTSLQGTSAVGYKFSRERVGKLKSSSALRLFNNFFSFLICGFAIYLLLNPKVDLGLPNIVYSLSAFGVFLFLTSIENRKLRKILLLKNSHKAIEGIEDSYGKEPLIDLPQGSVARAQNGVSVVLHQLPHSSRKLILAPLDGLDD